MRYHHFSIFLLLAAILSSCADSGGMGSGGSGNMGSQPSPEVRREQISSEKRGNFFYGRRYRVDKTRFWGYLRKPGQSARSARLVILNETQKRAPDRLREYGSGKTFGFDNNYEYRMFGRYTGRTLYDPNSNQFLPEFMLTNYELVSTNPGWLFSPSDTYHPQRITLLPR